MELSVGYNGTLGTLKKIFSVKNHKVTNVYTGGLEGILTGGRRQYIKKLEDMIEHVELARRNNATITLTLNTPLDIREKEDTLWWNKIREYFIRIEKIGISGVILSHPFLIQEAKKVTNLEVTASTICEISDAREALYYESIGADIIVPASKINYNIDKLIEIKKSLSKARIKLMVNEYCLGGCPFRKFHWNHLASREFFSDKEYSRSCSTLYLKDKYKVLTSSVIRPEDLKKFAEVTNYFKLLGRNTNITDEYLMKSIEAYSNESFEGNFVSLSSVTLSNHIKINNSKLNNLFEIRKNCSYDCLNCKNCMELYETSKEGGDIE